ncbi:aminoacylase-1-like [Galleria mellonella]|uniref:N-acyl-aliphatic-L-amino acid amidohydrolase n=1 Tax=Galleria mellonella TaxID=7137 RepID=A0A6J3BSK6_GALME|nr:aminoacylase-1-like [Galleria mellonella]XP_031762936.2 aminoacylase-1-like [Galleria mellonella]
MQWVLFGVVFCGLYGVNGNRYADDPAVQRFQEYIRINTTTGGDLTPAVEFWTRLAAEQDVPINVYEYTKGYPIIVLKWAGLDSSLNSIQLNSHVDVVPADESEGWTYPPFGGVLTENGRIYGRGTQDMKSVTIQYYEALSRIKANNITLLRDVYMTIMPDEEVGGEDGMIPFLQSEEFSALNVGLELDEGAPSPIPIIPLFYQDKVVWQIKVDCYGEAAHGSTFPATNSTATGKCRNVIDALLKFREEQYIISTRATIFDAGVYTSVNLNRLNGGTANNIIPSVVSLTFDIRLGTRVNEDAFQAQLEQWIAEAGENITLTYISKNPQSPATVVSLSNPYWRAINQAARSLKVPIIPIVPPGSTDARHVRLAGVPAFGISPMANTPLLLHAVDEYLPASTFLKGINIYEQIITKLANIPSSDTSPDPSVYIVKTAL